MHLTEGRNTGFQKIINALKQNGSPKPLFETDDERTYFATTLFIHPAFEVDDTENVGENVGEKPLTKREKQILDCIRQDPLASSKIMSAQIGVSERTVERAIKGLKSKGAIGREGPDKGGHWVINR